MDLTPVFLRLGVALGLGLLVGLQRERAAAPLAGIRTFPLVTIFGAVAALLSHTMGAWVVAAGLLGLAAIIAAAKFVLDRTGDQPHGMTTDVAALLMYGVGAYVMVAEVPVGVAIAGGVAVLLQLKEPLHRFVARIGENDVRAIMQFTLVALVILPILPNKEYGPYHVLNPHRIWMMVVLIVGISLAAYVAHKVIGARAGTILSGLLGGLISSTATTVSSARQVRAAPDSAAAATLVITLATAVVYAREMVLIAAVNRAVLPAMAGPLICMLLFMIVLCAIVFFLPWRAPADNVEHGNPAELRTALVFGLLYTAVLLATAAAKAHLGGGGLYLVAIGAGLTDVDAITLTTSRMVAAPGSGLNGGGGAAGQITAETGWRLIMAASMSNLVFKGAAAAVLGGWRLTWRIWAVFGAAMAASAALLIFWQ